MPNIPSPENQRTQFRELTTYVRNKLSDHFAADYMWWEIEANAVIGGHIFNDEELPGVYQWDQNVTDAIANLKNIYDAYLLDKKDLEDIFDDVIVSENINQMAGRRAPKRRSTRRVIKRRSTRILKRRSTRRHRRAPRS